MNAAVLTRQTKYCQAIVSILTAQGHATNAELLQELRKRYATVSATTVHRATTRLAERGTIALAPPSTDGSMRYDITVKAHDHFVCTNCGVIKDADIMEQVSELVESSIKGCRLSGRLTIGGVCKQCVNYKEEV